MIMMYVPTINEQTASLTVLNKPKEQTEVIQPVVYTLNHVAMNKKQVDQMQFSLEKRLDKRNWIHPTHRTRRSIVL